MKKKLLILILSFVVSNVYAQKLAVKTNLLGWATLTTNLGLEVALAPRWTLDLDGFYNPMNHGNHKKTQFWAVQPELRIWTCCKYTGHFFGLHGQYSEYDFGLNKYNYNGWLSGAGISYGYVLPIGPRWKAEFNLGAGWNRVSCDTTGRIQYPGDVVMYDPIKKNYWGITRAGISIYFIIR